LSPQAREFLLNGKILRSGGEKLSIPDSWKKAFRAAIGTGSFPTDVELPAKRERIKATVSVQFQGNQLVYTVILEPLEYLRKAESFVQDIHSLLSEDIPVEDKIRKAVERLQKLLPVEKAVLVSVREGDRIRPEFIFPETRGTSEFPFFAELMRWGAKGKTKNEWLCCRVEEYPGLRERDETVSVLEDRFVLQFPVVEAGKIIGYFLCIGSFDLEDVNRLRPQLRRLASVLASLLSVWLLKERKEKFHQQLEFLRQLPGVLSQQDGEDVFKHVAELAIRTLHFWELSVFRFDPVSGELILVGSAGHLGEVLKVGFRHPVSEGVIGWVARNRKPRYVRDISTDPLYVNYGRRSTGSELAIPIEIGGEIYGVINLESPVVDGFDEVDIEILKTLAQQLALHLRQYENVQQEKRRAQLASLMGKVSTLLHERRDEGEIAQQFINLLREEMDVFYVSFYRYDADKHQLIKICQSGGKNSPRPVGSTWPADQGALGYVVRTRKPCYIPDVSAAEVDYVPISDYDRGSELCLPVQVNGQLYGIVNIESYRRDEFTNEAIILLLEVVNHFGKTISNVQLFEKILDQKRKIETIFSRLGNGVLIFDADQNLVYANEAVRQFFPKLRLNNVRCSDLPIYDEMKEWLESDAPFWRVEYSPSQHRYWRIDGIRSKGGNGENEIYIILQDITHEHQRHVQRLESERLKVAMEMAGSVAHELNQPLTGILGYCSLLLEELDPDSETAEEVRMIEEQASRIAELLKKFQNVVKIKTKPYPGDTSIIDWEESEVLE